MLNRRVNIIPIHYPLSSIFVTHRVMLKGWLEIYNVCPSLFYIFYSTTVDLYFYGEPGCPQLDIEGELKLPSNACMLYSKVLNWLHTI